jgi:flagellum-specific peptidoglycan hydrolase FlgJ
MKKFLISALTVLCVTITAQAQRTGQAQQKYIETYSDIAVQEMLRTGVPASITLAQGLLESGA